jgi:hypothetical protein
MHDRRTRRSSGPDTGNFISDVPFDRSFLDVFDILVRLSFMTCPTLAGGKSQQFAILKIDTIFNFYRPKPPLSKFVDSFWLYEGYNAERRTEPILPTGRLELAINLRQDEMRFHDFDVSRTSTRFSAAVVSGAHGQRFVPAAREELCVIGVHFKPGGAFPFLGLPASDLADTHVDLDILWGASRRAAAGAPL